jgi:cell division protein FtsL
VNEATARKYGNDFVLGNLAYDLANVDFAEDMPLEAAPEVAETPAVKENTRTATRAAARSVQSVAPFSIIGTVCIAVLVVFMLMSYVQLVSISEESVALEQQLEELQLEKVKLLIDYESAFNLTEIEEYATTELGMQKPRSNQIYYVDGSAPDKAEIIDNGVQKTGIFSLFDDLLDSLGEYFG